MPKRAKKEKRPAVKSTSSRMVQQSKLGAQSRKNPGIRQPMCCLFRRAILPTSRIRDSIQAYRYSYRRWATIENLKRIADTSNFLTEHGIGSYEELLDRCEAASASVARLKADLRDTGAKIDELTLKVKHVGTYRQLKPIYDRYKASMDKEKFLRGHESEIILFEAAARECKRLGAVPLPATERMQTEMDELNARKAALKAELQKAQHKEHDYAAMRQSVEDFLSPPQPEQERKKNVELE